MSAKAPEGVHTALVHRLGWTSTAGKLAKPALTLEILRRAGVPLHVAFESELPHNRLVAALSSVPLASVTLHHSPLMLHPRILSQVVSALTASAQTLTALRCLPLAAMAPCPPTRAGADSPHAAARPRAAAGGALPRRSASRVPAGQPAGADADASCPVGRHRAGAAGARRLRQPSGAAAHHARRIHGGHPTRRARRGGTAPSAATPAQPGGTHRPSRPSTPLSASPAHKCLG